MHVHRGRLKTIRGRILLWYLAALSAVLLGYCAFQTVTLSDYFQSTNAYMMQQTAAAELATVGLCPVQSPADLRLSASPLALLLGSQSRAATIVTSDGTVLASQSTAATDTARPSAALIRRLIPLPDSRGTRARLSHGLPRCRPGTGASHPSAVDHPSLSAVRSGDVLFTAVPLGPARRPAGYAILGRSVATEGAALLRLRSTLWAGALFVLLITAVVALPIMNHALRPLARVTATAEAVAAGDMDRRANLRPAVDEVGRLGSAFDTMVDRLQEALSCATTSESHMRRFLADASHELRTPLTVLCGTSEILRQHALDRLEMDAALLAMNQEATRMSRLVDDLLHLSRLDAGQSLRPRPVTLSSFLEGFTARCAFAWPERTIEVDRSRLNGTRVLVDPEALTRMLTNLVDNAARYTPPGGAIRIEASGAGMTASIAVADAGPGLSPEDAKRVFERFYRGGKSRSRRSGGSGLGLAIVKALVDQSHGEVRLDTGPDRGTTVTITLPRRTDLGGSSGRAPAAH